MELLENFKSYLLLNKASSHLTVKNYIADIRKFIFWYQNTFSINFNPSSIQWKDIERFQEESKQKVAVRSVERYLSSLRKFFSYLELSNLIPSSPFESAPQNLHSIKSFDKWDLKSFKDFLYNNGASKLTIKNYLSDIRSFTKWYEESIVDKNSYVVNSNAFPKLSHEAVEEYKKRLLHVLNLSPRTINRKLSSVRSLVRFALEKGFIQPTPIPVDIPTQPSISLSNIAHRTASIASTYSSFPPLSLFQKIFSPVKLAEDKIASVIASKINRSQLEKEVQNTSKTNKNDQQMPGNIKKEFFAPYNIALGELSLRKKILHHLRYTRPAWYAQYSSLPITHYLHWTVLIIFATALGYGIYQNLTHSSQGESVLAAQDKDGRIISFAGQLTDVNGTPITKPTDLRFGIYSSPSASGSALLWQEAQINVRPENDGSFTVLLGSDTPIAGSLFDEIAPVYLGITIGRTDELAPRQKLFNTSYTQDSEMLQGMKPITQTGVGNKNVILALDSSGNLTIGGASNTSFQSTGGKFRLAGLSLLLTTVTGSSGDVVISPDGDGKISLEKPLVNMSENGNISGALEIADQLYINASSSAAATIIVNNNSALGDLFAASSAGLSRFVIKGNGDIAIDGRLIIEGVSYTWPDLPGKNGSVLTTDSDGQLSWTDGSTASLFYNNNEAITASNPTVDLLLGGNSTGSAKFSVTNLISQTPKLTLSSGTGNSIHLTSNGSITTTNNQSLNLETEGTGDINFKPNGITAMTILAGGRVGIGTINPAAKVEIADSQAAGVTAMITNLDTGPDADGLAIKLGYTGAGNLSNRFITFLNGTGATQGRIESDAANGVKLISGGTDYAEYFKKQDPEEQFEAGDLVCIGSQTGGIVRCSSENKQILGIVSNSAIVIGGASHEADISYALIGLVGQHPVKVSYLSGLIKPGEPLSFSNIPGVASKPTSAGYIVGHALESYDPFSTNKTVLVSLAPTWYDPGVVLSQNGNLVFEPSSPVYSEGFQSSNTEYSLKNGTGDLVKRLETFSDLISANISAGFIKAEKVGTQTLIASKGSMHELSTQILEVTSDNITINGQSLKDYIAETVSQLSSPIQSGSTINSPLASTEIATNIISPLGDDSNIAIKLDNSQLSILNPDSIGASPSAVAILDNQGNASFKGNLSSKSLETNDASVSGTLYADKIAANTIEGLEEKIRSNLANQQSQNPLGVENWKLKPENLNYIDISTLSAQFALITDGIISLGTSTFREASVYDSLYVGQNLAISQNAINVVGETLEIQSLRQGGVSFLAGLITIDTEGNLNVSGNAYFAKNVSVNGSLLTNLISPLSDSDIVIKLSPGNQNQIPTGSLVVQDASGSAVVRFTNQGDLQASGSGSFAKLNLNLIGQAHAISETEAVATGSAGIATLKASRSEITIKNPLVTDKSLIYISPTGNTNDAVIYLLRQAPGESFTVGINSLRQVDIPFNWIIVN